MDCPKCHRFKHESYSMGGVPWVSCAEMPPPVGNSYYVYKLPNGMTLQCGCCKCDEPSFMTDMVPKSVTIFLEKGRTQ